MNKMKHINMYTDGACKGNPGPGGYGVVLEYNGKEKIHSQGFANTTNNRMELSAVIEGLKLLKEACQVDLYSDSKYVVDAIEKGWLSGWQKNNWKKSDKKDVLNVDLWKELIPLLDFHKVKFIWVKGHAGNPNNERCDQLACEEAEKFL